MKKIKKNRVLKWIKEQTKVLSPETYIAYIGENKEPEEFPVNHNRRVWRLYKKFGLEGVNYYFILRGYTLNSVNPLLED